MADCAVARAVVHDHDVFVHTQRLQIDALHEAEQRADERLLVVGGNDDRERGHDVTAPHPAAEAVQFFRRVDSDGFERIERFAGGNWTAGARPRNERKEVPLSRRAPGG